MSEKQKFWIRLVCFTLFACVLPFVFLAYRYDLFTKVNKIQIGGWGIVAIVIVFFFVKYVCSMIKQGMPYSMTTQIITGVCKVIVPLALVWALAYSIKDNIDVFLQSLGIVIVCEAIAIPINPLPKWVETHKRNQQDTFMDMFVDKLYKKKGEEEKC